LTESKVLSAKFLILEKYGTRSWQSDDHRACLNIGIWFSAKNWQTEVVLSWFNKPATTS